MSGSIIYIHSNAMGHLMPMQVSLLPESLIAKAASERPDILVHSHVHHQVVRLGEGLATHLASLVVPDGLVDVGQVVRLYLVKASVVVADLGHHGRGLCGLAGRAGLS